MPNQEVTFADFLLQHQSAILDAVATQFKQQISYYHDVADAELRTIVQPIIELFLQAWQTKDPQKMINRSVRSILSSVQQGMNFTEGLRISTIYRSILIKIAFDALNAQISDASAGFQFFSDALDHTVERVGTFYYDQLQDSRESLSQFQSIIETAQDAVAMFQLNGSITYVNPATYRLLELDSDLDITGLQADEFFTEADRPRFLEETIPAMRIQGSWQGRLWVQTGNDQQKYCDIVSFYVQDVKSEQPLVGAILRDVTAEYRAQQQRETMQRELFALQEKTLIELVAPMIPLTRHTLLVPVIGDLDDRRMQQITHNLLKTVNNQRSMYVIVDITGVPALNTSGARGLIETAKTVRLLGARLILTGIHPDVAQTLVSSGISFADIMTRARLQDGIAFVLKQATR